MQPMNEDQQSDSAWLSWDEVMRRVASLMHRQDFRTAQVEVDSFLARDTSPEIRSEALSVRADLKEEVGDLQSAREDLLSARSLVGPGYARYVQEISLG